ncbi:hypothetical protein ACS0TY_007069 [Phlomoides rotata]
MVVRPEMMMIVITQMKAKMVLMGVPPNGKSPSKDDKAGGDGGKAADGAAPLKPKSPAAGEEPKDLGKDFTKATDLVAVEAEKSAKAHANEEIIKADGKLAAPEALSAEPMDMLMEESVQKATAESKHFQDQQHNPILIDEDEVAGNQTLYGVCLQVHEVVQRPPKHGALKSISQSLFGCNRFSVSAPRCFCILTRVPFFELHYEMLNRRVTSPILVDRAITHAAAAASIISDEEASCRFEYPEKAIASEGLKHQIIVKLGIWIRMIARMCMLLMILPQRILKTNQMVAIHRMLAHALAIKPNHWSALYETLLSQDKSMTMEEDGETLNNHDDIPTNDMILQWVLENQVYCDQVL